MSKPRTRRRTAGLATAGALVLGTLVSYSAQGAAPSATPKPGPATASATTGIPGVVDPVADLGRQSPGPEREWFDSIYFTSSVKANGHDFGLQVHTRVFPNMGQAETRWTFAVTDKTTGWHKDYEAIVAPDDYRWTEGKLDIKAPGLSWTGDSVRQTVRVTTPWGSLNVQMVPTGPALNYASTGVFTLVDVPAYEFALPKMRTSGTLVIGNKKHEIRGTSWLDRQWGEMPTALKRWTWMNLNMPNGDKVAIWNSIGEDSEHSWATVLHPNGSYDVVEVEPLAQGASKPWTSPETGQVYPTRWQVRIPHLRAELAVRIVGTPGQEVKGQTAEGGYMEAAAAFEGTYNGKKVRGENYVEMNGDWRTR
ncbi:lipocalin family protein [Streptomyces xinghaiensis]|uniref:lipocalin family protein n=1 Tax=Streptomyces xinghaiensis TaxID=1038928 RepID=UPI0005855F22|nr:lipocalin family protein [Streptomyces xinghaiensis]MZE77890.1 hydrolase [Streptomyces sp. SID5475]